MRLFTIPAQYRAYIEAELAVAVARIGDDVKRRAAGKPGLPDFPEWALDANADDHRVLIGVLVPNDNDAATEVHAALTLLECVP